MESREASLDKPETLQGQYPVPEAVPVLHGFTQLDREGLEELLASTAWPWTSPT